MSGLVYGLLLEACRGVEYRTQWAYERIVELPGAVEAQHFFQKECPGDRLNCKRKLVFLRRQKG